MGLEDYEPELDSGDEGGGQVVDKQSEKVSEKFRESVKRGTAGIKRTTQDEKKAKKKDMMLASFLVKIILDKKYDPILDTMFAAMDAGHPSNIVLGVLSLIYPDISHAIRAMSGKSKVTFEYSVLAESSIFDDANIDDSIKNRINSWIEDIIDIVTLEHSSVMVERVQKNLGVDDAILIFTRQVFAFFLEEINIEITDIKAQNIAHFILSETLKSIDQLEVEKI
ncbi:hypothetical protein OAN96_00235 [Candidatus Gracilibacteria bacterium]|nr:hypothetical protein [Candidatus Gracilibacteria bacterium]